MTYPEPHDVPGHGDYSPPEPQEWSEGWWCPACQVEVRAHWEEACEHCGADVYDLDDCVWCPACETYEPWWEGCAHQEMMRHWPVSAVPQ